MIRTLTILIILLSTSLTFAANDEIHWTILSQTSVAVSWRTTTGDSNVSIGTTSGNYTRTISAQPAAPAVTDITGTFYDAIITGLTENTTYYYRIGASGGDTGHFKTPIPAGSSNFTVWSQSDMQDYGSSAYTRMMAVQNLIAASNPAFVLIPGDLHPDSTSEVHNKYVEEEAWSHNAATFPISGNHDVEHPEVAYLNAMKGRFVFPNPQTITGVTPTQNAGGEDWYWFDYGNVRFIAIPYDYNGGWSQWYTVARSASGPFATAQSNPNITFIVTFGHWPPYCSGYHDDDGTSSIGQYLNTLGDTYSKYKLNISGHSHLFERTTPRHGVVHIVDSSPQQTEPWQSSPASFDASRYLHLGAVKLTFSATGITGQFICGGSFSDQSLTCNVGDVIEQWTIGAPSGCTDTTWTPDPATICLGTQFTQTSNCGTTRTSTGTKTCDTGAFFPRGMFETSDGSHNALFASLGFNAVNGPGDISYLNTAQSLGMKVMVWLGDYNNTTCQWEQTDSIILAKVDAVKGHPALLGYFLADEPEQALEACPNVGLDIKSRSNLVKTHDSVAPTYILVSNSAYVAGHRLEMYPYHYFAGSADIVGFDIYPCRQPSTSACVFSEIDSAIAAASEQGISRYYAVLQDFEDTIWRRPTPAEVRTQFDRWATSRMEGYWIFSWDWMGNSLDGNTAHQNEFIYDNARIFGGTTTAPDKPTGLRIIP